MKHFTDQEIVDAIRNRNVPSINRAATALYEQHQQMVMAFVRRYGGSTEDGEDVFQETAEVFIQKIFDEPFSIEKEGAVAGMIYRIAEKNWYKKIRAKKSRTAREEKYMREFEAQTPDVSSPEANLIGLEEHQWSQRIFDRLNSASQRILRAFYRDEMSYKEIVEKYGYPTTDAAKMHKSRALADLRKNMKLI